MYYSKSVIHISCTISPVQCIEAILYYNFKTSFCGSWSLILEYHQKQDNFPNLLKTIFGFIQSWFNIAAFHPNLQVWRCFKFIFSDLTVLKVKIKSWYYGRNKSKNNLIIKTASKRSYSIFISHKKNNNTHLRTCFLWEKSSVLYCKFIYFL